MCAGMAKVTVALPGIERLSSSMPIGLPTIKLRPSTTTRLPAVSIFERD